MKMKKVWVKFSNDQEIYVLLRADHSLAEGFDWQGFVDSEGKNMWLNPDRVICMKEIAYVERYW